jgi:hypothetical protein
MEKVCFKCNALKPINDYYKHPLMADGRLNKCKDCTKNDTKRNYEKNISKPEYIEKERARGRDKHRRLYAGKSNKKHPWSDLYKYKSLRRKFKFVPFDYELHHWSYKDENLEDIIIVHRFEHKKIHNKLKLIVELRCFETISGELLDTKEKHCKFIESLGYKIYNTQFIVN